jgi:hypothetical protein
MSTRNVLLTVMSLILLLPISNACNKPLKPAEFIVSNVDISPIEAAPFEKITVSALVINAGDVADNYTALLKIDGDEREKQVVSIGPSENKTIVFSVFEPSIGQHEIQIGSYRKTFVTYETSIGLLQHDNGVDLSTWLQIDPMGQWTSFAPPALPYKIDKVLVRGKLWNVNDAEKRSYTIKIWDKGFNKELFSRDYPYTRFTKDTATVEHEISPSVIVSGDFIVDFISHGVRNDDKTYSSIAVCTDYTVNDSNNIGFSKSGFDAPWAFSQAKVSQPSLIRASWIIQSQGECRAQTRAAEPATENVTFKGIPATLRYDYLNTSENLYSQVAIAHSYVSLYQGLWSLTVGREIKAPLIILPGKDGAVNIVKGASEGYQYSSTGGLYYKQTYDDKYLLNMPGWGLATTFHPENGPFRIDTIKMACVANYSMGILDDYDNKYVKIQILDKESRIIWSQFFPWSKFRSNSTTAAEGFSQATWTEIPTGGIIVNDDFTVEILSLSKVYWRGDKAYDYFAVAYERVGDCGNSKTNSYISENGGRPDPWVSLYNQYGNPDCFNLCLRVDGTY